MEEDILEQDVDEKFEEDMEDLEKEVEQTSQQKNRRKISSTPQQKQQVTKQTRQRPQQVGQPVEQQVGQPVGQPTQMNETYEAFAQPARIGIVNTLTGETIEGFTEKDQAIVQLGKLILNKLDKIAIASGA